MGGRIVVGDLEVDQSNPLPILSVNPVTLSYRKLATADTNLAVPKASAGKLYSLNITNVSAGTKYLKIYNKATNPVLATDVPVVTIPVVAGGSVNHTFAGNIGLNFTLGIAIAITGAIADTDTTILVANDVVLTLVYS
jgi:hypothetical protein